MGTPIAASDLTWLHMDRPNNLMHVHGLLAFDRLPDWDELKIAVFERVVTKYRVLSQVPVHHGGHWEWEDDVDFSIRRHMRRVVLPDSSPEALRRHISQQFSLPFDRTHPLWEMQLIAGPDDEGGVLLTRFHHGLGDGIRLVQLILGMCDPTTGATPRAVGRRNPLGTHGALGTVRHVAEHSIKDTIDYVQHAGEAALGAGRTVMATLNPLELPHHVEAALDLVRHPVRLIDALTSFASDDNEWSNSWREISRMVLSEKADAGAWSGVPSGDKGVSWLDGVSLDAVKAAAQRYHGTVNDMLLATVSLALTDYLGEHGVDEVHDLSWLMPVSLRPIDGSLPDTLGNHFAVVLMSMPLGIRDVGALVEEISQRTNRLKHSAEPALAFGVQRVIAEAPSVVAQRLTDFFSDKTIGQLTNVPGPSSQISLVGAPVRSVLGWVPTSGDQPLGVCLFTYNGMVSAGIAADSSMIPDPHRLTELMQEHIDALIGATRDDTAPTGQPSSRSVSAHVE
jgi:diacylglycerol O-acyltransferase